MPNLKHQTSNFHGVLNKKLRDVGLHDTGGALSCFLTNFFDTPHAYQKAGEIIFIRKEKKARGSYRKKCRGVEGLKVIPEIYIPYARHHRPLSI